jgi:hypothetical protein
MFLRKVVCGYLMFGGQHYMLWRNLFNERLIAFFDYNTCPQPPIAAQAPKGVLIPLISIITIQRKWMALISNICYYNDTSRGIKSFCLGLISILLFSWPAISTHKKNASVHIHTWLNVKCIILYQAWRYYTVGPLRLVFPFGYNNSQIH